MLASLIKRLWASRSVFKNAANSMGSMPEEFPQLVARQLKVWSDVVRRFGVN